MVARYQQPRFRSIAAGIALFLLILGFISILSIVVKWLGYPLLYLPSRLGLVQQVTPADVQRFDLNAPESQFVARAAGQYAIYTADRELLELDVAAKRPWLRVISQVTGKDVRVHLVGRGLRPYDTPYAPGRPVLNFTIEQPGVYLLSHLSLTPPEEVAVVPDYVTGREKVILVLAIVQLALVLGPPGWWLARRKLTRQRAANREHVRRREESDDLMERLRSRKR